MRHLVRIAAGVAAAATIVLIAASCDDDDDLTGPGPTERIYSASLFSSNEVGTGSTDTGRGLAIFVDNATRIDWTLTLDGITAVTASHIHGPALPGSNVGVIFNLYMPSPPTGPLDNFTATGSITGSPTVSLDSLRTLFNNGRAYVNVHTTPFPGGAVRGQVVRTN